MGLSLDAWRARQSEGEDATLPSGLQIKIKRVGVLDLAERGEIPQTIQPQIDAFMSATNGNAPQVGLKEFQKFAAVINLVCAACIVAPAELDAKELPYADRLALFNWANEVNVEMTTFREVAPANVAIT